MRLTFVTPATEPGSRFYFAAAQQAAGPRVKPGVTPEGEVL